MTTDERFYHDWKWGNSHARYYALDCESYRALESLANKWFYACIRRLEAKGR